MLPSGVIATLIRRVVRWHQMGIVLAVVAALAVMLCLGVAMLMLPWWLAAQEEEYQREFDRTSTPSVSVSPR